MSFKVDTVLVRNKFLLILFSLMMGCASDLQRHTLDETSKTIVEQSAKINPACTALSAKEVNEISGRQLVFIETTSPDVTWCRYTLDDGRWFSISRSPWYRAVDVPLDCYDEQNAPNAYRKIHLPYCAAIIGDKRLEINSSQHWGVAKPAMRALLEKAILNLEY